MMMTPIQLSKQEVRYYGIFAIKYDGCYYLDPDIADPNSEIAALMAIDSKFVALHNGEFYYMIREVPSKFPSYPRIKSVLYIRGNPIAEDSVFLVTNGSKLENPVKIFKETLDWVLETLPFEARKRLCG